MTGRVNFGKDDQGDTIGYGQDAHLLSISPTGGGKGATSIIPNLLHYSGSVFVIDPKGENAMRTYSRRKALNGAVYVLDPFAVTPFPSASFNPLADIPLNPDGITQAERLADSLILPEKGGENRYFSDEARAALKALILHVRTYPEYEGARHLGKVNELASYPRRLFGTPDEKGEMQFNAGYEGLVKRLAARIALKAEREYSSVMATVQSNLSQFLDDPRIVECLSSSSFSFKMLKTGKASVFLVLPPHYLETFNRWLRLMVSTALDQLLEGMSEATKPDPPVLFILDEFAHLGKLESVQTAYGVARGAGIKIWAFLQSLSQLDELYGQHGRETFIANSGAIEIFNMNDNHGLEYFSKRAGEEYVRVESVQVAESETQSKGASSVSSGITKTTSASEERRPRLMSAHIAALDPGKKLYFQAGRDFGSRDFKIINKVYYFEHEKMRHLVDDLPSAGP
jgi:type IV secretion system protein VirD4